MFKKLTFIISLFLFLTLHIYAQGSSVTVVRSHDTTKLSWYDNYDSFVKFPDGSQSFNKIVLDFTLGKYQCPGYNPANAGEGANQTGWCADWDYDIHVLACTPTDTFELAELITPYANSTFPYFPWTWKQSYRFDVTDYYHVLKDSVMIRVFYSGYSGGFTGTIDFIFTEGTRPRDVVGFQNLWRGSYPYGNAAQPIEGAITTQTVHFPSNAISAESKVIISGHGGDNVENCAEFCRKWYRLNVEDSIIVQQDIWRDDCGKNGISPQSGTWIYNRANWCPGEAVKTIVHKMPEWLLPGNDFDINMEFQPYSGSSSASYKLSNTLFFYGDFNFDNDAGIEDIISPSTDMRYRNLNPICGKPVVKVKNYGKNDINSIKFEYGVVGKSLIDYIWNGTALGSNEEAFITLESIEDLYNAASRDSFIVRIVEVNGTNDDNQLNNESLSELRSVRRIHGHLAIEMQASGTLPGGVANYTSWEMIELETGAIVAQGSVSATSSVSRDTLRLNDGCYKLKVINTHGYGLAFFSNINPRGHVRMQQIENGASVTINNAYLGNAALESNFGSGFEQHFKIDNNSINVQDIQSDFSLNIYPNPTKDNILIDLLGPMSGKTKVQLINILGQIVYETESLQKQISISTAQLADGQYYLKIENNGIRKIEKIVIAK